ncbi:hypothetical protein NDU88_002894 [Pleurodeles waltl]|uniref:Uncharacterized protein n=1 Tax=Pleurodeles waltl TaxID=8319 RepID=A0AAV7MPC0_PLEWA|nr:hypothetical protein NDU88_002894 [Pleurodeles waltl]
MRASFLAPPHRAPGPCPCVSLPGAPLRPPPLITTDPPHHPWRWHKQTVIPLKECGTRDSRHEIGSCQGPNRGQTRPQRPQSTQKKEKCPAQGPQSSGLDQLVLLFTPLQVYLKKSGVTNKFAFLKDPAAAFFSNPDTDEGLPTPLVPQTLGIRQSGFDASTNSIQYLGLDLPLLEVPKKQAFKEYYASLVHERQNNLRVTSSPIAHKNLQVGSTLIMAQDHAQEGKTLQGDQQQGTTVNSSNTVPPVISGNLTEAYNNTVHAGIRQQSAPIPWSNFESQGIKERLDIGFDASTGNIEDSWLQSLSITNNKALGEALDLKT